MEYPTYNSNLVNAYIKRFDIRIPRLAELELYDFERKGCIDLDCAINNNCKGCKYKGKHATEDCPVFTWHKRHPEWQNDGTEQLIERLKSEDIDIKFNEFLKNMKHN